ncbi:hypothetical protein TWF102_004391 [Orbilia oligospora]|uniref:SWIM-type domain-containing protein n=1 Tax=Orbilia oligospora TaxID=2813651 RepID=A0A7C8JXK4_ORBOL|nr:hypothetical protein TWF706_003897 [Orbilia oligospora]KAF3102725.1 hypothetical protein TWF102_004391 [Orbilia oligospora]KAF3124936.1 hypothetical protein TWF703_011144 [Orbilia oligospora]KAF3136318.1 hypothetical protein TWF594_007954 [Orbilia oligospora]
MESSSSYTGRSRRDSPVKYIRGQAGIYNNSNRMTKQQWAWAEDGIQQSHYSVSCKEGSRYYTFKLNAYPPQDGYALGRFEAKVCIGPEGSKHEYPTCTCRDYVEAQRACRHIFYILDNVLSYENQELEDIKGTMPLRIDGHCLRSHTGPYDQIKSRGLSYIAQSHMWMFSGPGEWSVSDQTKDMLRHLDQSTDYSASHYSDEYLSTSPSLAGAVYRLAISNPEFLADLRKEAPVDPCSKSYFRLLDQQIDYAFRRWINYTKTGCPRLNYRDDDTHPDNLGTPNVPWIAGRLRRLVYDIEMATVERSEMSYENYRRAFGLLIKMLESVIDMDLDASELDYRPRVEMASGTGMERNLFTRLIGRYSPDHSNFAISVMRRISHAGQPFLPRLLDCRQVIHEKASREFADEFETLLREIQN